MLVTTQVAGYITAKHIIYIYIYMANMHPWPVKSQADHADSLGNSSGNQADIKCSTMQLIKGHSVGTHNGIKQT